jgi:uncharacterized protein YjaG (DUF416 family)
MHPHKDARTYRRLLTFKYEILGVKQKQTTADNQLNWKNWNHPQNTTSESDTWVPLFIAHLEPKVLACLMSLTLEERDALQYESKVWFTTKLSSLIYLKHVI